MRYLPPFVACLPMHPIVDAPGQAVGLGLRLGHPLVTLHLLLGHAELRQQFPVAFAEVAYCCLLKWSISFMNFLVGGVNA